jgi:hypothetical protein
MGSTQTKKKKKKNSRDMRNGSETEQIANEADSLGAGCRDGFPEGFLLVCEFFEVPYLHCYYHTLLYGTDALG